MQHVTRYFAPLWSGAVWRGHLYLLAGLPLSITWFTYTVVMLAVGVALVAVWVGIPLLVATLVSLRWIGASERAMANAMIDAGVAKPGPRRARASTTPVAAAPVRWSFEVMADAHAWRVAIWTAMRIVLGPVGFTAALLAVIVPVALVVALVAALFFVAGGADWLFTGEGIEVALTASWWTVVGAPVILAILPWLGWAARGLVIVHRPLARWTLGPLAADLAAEATARAEVAEEQVRIDQELHDSIGHMITMNVVQAGAGAHVFDTDPAFARQALKNIEERGRAAMGELDRIIAQIRGDRPPSRAPLPGIADIEGLIATSRAAGARVTSCVEAPAVPAALGRAAFGIVREALTNGAKHAPGASVQVRVGEHEGVLVVAITNGQADPGAQPAASATGGRGVAGMRDRIELLGGRHLIGPTAGGGFEVMAALPLGSALGVDELDEPWWARLRETVAP